MKIQCREDQWRGSAGPRTHKSGAAGHEALQTLGTGMTVAKRCSLKKKRAVFTGYSFGGTTHNALAIEAYN